MERNQLVRAAVILFIALGVVVLLAGPYELEAAPKTEYKFVRLADSGGMPSITEALNKEAERGWELDEMAVAPGEPGTIYLVFKK